jgi:hypothetical protein
MKTSVHGEVRARWWWGAALSGLLGACAVDASANPARRCDASLACPAGLACYRGYCVIGGSDAALPAPTDAGGLASGDAGQSAPPGMPAEPESPEPEVSGEPTAPEPMNPSEPRPEAKPEKPEKPEKPQEPAPSPEPEPEPEPRPEPAPTPEPTPAPSDLCRLLCEHLGECDCMSEEQPEWGCRGARVPCGDRCVDLRSDDDHCGGCNLRCERGSECKGAVCRWERDGEDDDDDED